MDKLDQLLRSDVTATILYILTAIFVVLRTGVEIQALIFRIQANRRLAREIAECADMPLAPPFDPVRYEARRQEFLAAGWEEPFPGVFTLSFNTRESPRPA